MNRRPELVFVISLPRSGSTLLGHMLGAIPSVLYTGEVPAPILKGRPIRCRLCDTSSCPIWGDAVPPDFVRRCFEDYRRAGRSYLRQRLNATARHLTKRGMPPGVLFTELFERLPQITTIVDSSKHLPWVTWNRMNQAYHCRYVFLVRDLRGVTASICRSSQDSVAAVAARTSKSLKKLQRFVSRLPSEDVLNMRYEDLVAAPEQSGHRLCDFLNVPDSQQFTDFTAHPSHVFGGNAGPVRQCRDVDQDRTSGGSLRLDHRWQSEFTANDIKHFERAAGASNQRIGYV